MGRPTDAAMTPTGVLALARRELPAALAAVLPTARWYGDKHRDLMGIEIVDAVADPWGDAIVVWAVAELRFTAGEPSRYAVAAVVELDAAAGAVTADRWFGDGMSAAGFPAWFLARLRDGARLAGARGELAFEPLPGLLERVGTDGTPPAQVGGLEQSNTNIRYGAVLLVKLFRRLRPGLNPDLEITRFLAERTTFRHAPRPLGVVRYLSHDSEPIVAAIAQNFIANGSDGWEWTLRALAAAFGDESRTAADSLDAALALLGRRTAEMHRALASDPNDPAFAPEPLTETTIDATVAAALHNLAATMTALRQRQGGAPPAMRSAIDEVLASERALAERLRGMAAERGSWAIRVHGDYHLGQTLRTMDADWIVLDFEGEPGRDLVERRRKTSALKDVSGMLRSIGYARTAAERAQPSAAVKLAAWETVARRAFLDAYLDGVRGAGPRLLPPDAAAFRRALDAWEADKALYEVRYEVANRPDWLATPLRALQAATG
ncbi:MAG: hypothetical protein IT337_06260 [Thermomicrobiales bacterium]|nr:hypothetical protein [Thermomicrobiales bacterium]